MHLQTCFVPPVAFVWLISLSRQQGLLLLAGAQRFFQSAGPSLLTERTYEHQQHPAFFSGEYGIHSCNMAALLSHIIPGRTASFFCTALHISSEVEMKSARSIRSEYEKLFSKESQVKIQIKLIKFI